MGWSKCLNRLLRKLRREPWFRMLSKFFGSRFMQVLLANWVTQFLDDL